MTSEKNKTKYKIIVIGSGPGGYPAAIRAADKGAKVALIEMEELGGVCLNTGCIPSKALIAAAALYDKMKKSADIGVNPGGTPSVNWPVMRSRKDKVVATMVGGVTALMKSHGVDVYKGFGTITGKNEVTVIDEDENETKLATENIIIATGSRPMNIPSFPLDGKAIMSSDHMLEIETLPGSLLIIGGGVIGCEWAALLAMLDVKVSVVELMDRLLPLEDAGTSQIMEREFKKMNIDVFTGVKVESIEPGPQGITAELSSGKTIDAEKTLLSVGRAFNIEDLGLDVVGVKQNKNDSITVDKQMRTNVKNIYAIGDVAGVILLAYTATAEGVVAVDNCLGEKATIDYRAVPSVIFTHPEIGSVGMTEEEAKKEGHELAIGRFPMRALGKAHAENEIAGECKVIADKKTDKILGVHIVGSHAAEVVHTAVLAIQEGLTASRLGEMIFAHPVISESLMEACHDVHGMSVHLGAKKKAPVPAKPAQSKVSA
ncbi:MAG: dihydrolipoyl dehydrogenase [candidate division Zixibacteria bacterium]|nr:dihydrolipoyl dehydrogenase [candidate division Zixibacteria bacterium]